eukprot:TRINITY_DN111795_c0_g1_i1.p1 TRINITY_DN111795_c0_g1~~TRINITY_DN111795_c0_g1_i1.p1  ORF type:complete len:199 (-),score=12.85 TRINITY_DN111795_c0_g1_i1:363-959(-)
MASSRLTSQAAAAVRFLAVLGLSCVHRLAASPAVVSPRSSVPEDLGLDTLYVAALRAAAVWYALTHIGNSFFVCDFGRKTSRTLPPLDLLQRGGDALGHILLSRDSFTRLLLPLPGTAFRPDHTLQAIWHVWKNLDQRALPMLGRRGVAFMDAAEIVSFGISAYSLEAPLIVVLAVSLMYAVLVATLRRLGRQQATCN